MTRQHRNRRARRGVRLLAVLTATTLLSAAAACGGDDDDGPSGGAGGGSGFGENIVDGPVAADSEPVTGGSVTVGLESETNSYLPSIWAGSQAGFNVAYAVFDPLMTRNEDNELEPYLAESFEPNDDFTEWTLTLRPDVLFHDATPLDAEALKTIFDEYLTVDGANTQGALRDVEEMAVVDDLTVTYSLSQPNAAFGDILVGPSGWPFSPTAAAELGDAFGDQPVGTGPFEFVSWQRDGAFVVERNDDYWQEGMPYLDEVTFRPIPDEETRATSLSSGDIDAAQSVRLSSFLARVRDLPDVEIALGLSSGGGNVMFNTTAPPTDDVRVRQALAHAIDQQSVVDVVAGEAAEVTELRSAFFATQSPYYSEAVAEAWPTQDLEQAQELYDEYVDDPERSDGQAPGSPVSFTYHATNVPSLVEQATAYQGFWQEIGFDVTIEPIEQSVLIQKALTSDYQAMNFRAGTEQDPLTVLEAALGDPEVFVTNFTNYTNETVEETLQTLRTTDDVEQRAAAVEELGLLLAEDLPVYWTGSDLAFFAYNQRVKGVPSWVLPSGTLGDGAIPGITFWSQVWLEE
ncbi:MAG TPA: ABC transporter substrate-binding protein [Acidimicrobiales bacterium]|nr:ABC transporter substrate-binding protein [Acidimicrobiales bacterium]